MNYSVEKILGLAEITKSGTGISVVLYGGAVNIKDSVVKKHSKEFNIITKDLGVMGLAITATPKQTSLFDVVDNMKKADSFRNSVFNEILNIKVEGC